MGIAAALILTAVAFAYTFWPVADPFTQRSRSQIDFLRERRDSVFANLRDLNFEYRAGKYPEVDFAAQREMLEAEAAALLQQIDALESA